MIRLVYLAEALLAAAAVYFGRGPVVWLFRECVATPAWLVPIAFAVAFVARMERHFTPSAWISWVHSSIRDRIGMDP